MLKLLLAALLVYLAVVAGVFLFQRRLMYHPSAEAPDHGAVSERGLAPVRVPTADGLSLLAWYAPSARPDGSVVLYLHGNAGHIGHRAHKVLPWVEAGHGILMLEWRGYGGNPGRPSEAGFRLDASAALAFLEAGGVPRGRIVAYGESIGGGPATWMAAQAAGAGRPLGGLVLEAPFTSAGAVAQRHYPWLPARWLVLDRYDNLSRIAAIGAPLLVLHGARDMVVPQSHGRRLLEAAAEPKGGFLPPDAGHGDLHEHGSWRAVLSILDGTAGGA